MPTTQTQPAATLGRPKRADPYRVVFDEDRREHALQSPTPERVSQIRVLKGQNYAAYLLAIAEALNAAYWRGYETGYEAGRRAARREA
jgi:hypothetical protein